MSAPAKIASAGAALEASACPNGCGEEHDRRLHEFGAYRVRLCARCGLARLDPRLSEADLAEFYEHEYFSGEADTGYDSYEKDQALYEKTFARRLKLIRHFKRGGTLLDVGCGYGYFLNVARREGFDAFGLDCSQHAVARCEASCPGKVRHGFLAPGVFADQFFDVVTMFDLFEHVYHPREFLQVVHRITKDDGVVVVTTPNRRSWLARASGRSWVSYKIPEHVYYYTPATLRRMAAPLFAVAHVRSEGQYCSLEFLAGRLKSLNRTVSREMLRAVRRVGAQDIAVYVNSGSMTAVLRKVPGADAR